MLPPARTAWPESARRWSTPVSVGICLAGLMLLAWTLTLWIDRSPGWGYDFRAYYDGALRLISTGTPYQPQTLGGPFRPGPAGLYLYSPLPAVLLLPLTALPEASANLVWVGLRVALLALTCALMPVSRNIRLAMLGIGAASGPVLIDLDLGNVSLVVTFLSVVMWRWLDRPLGAVSLAASLAVRPTMALFLPWWLVRERWRPVAWTIAAAVVLIVVTLPFVAPGHWLDYITVLRNVSDVTGVISNVDLGSAVLLLGGPAWAATAALFAGYLVAGAAVLWSFRRDREVSFVVTLMATLLLSPLLWDHYLTQLLVPAAFLASRGRTLGLALPLLGWLPAPLLPLVALAGTLLPFVVPDRGEPAGRLVGRLMSFRARSPAGP